MRVSAIVLAVLLGSPAIAQESNEESVIVVRGASLAETGKALEDCLARRCPPKEDIDATLAHAENQFLAGDYKSARQTLAKSHGRNARHARALPVEVSDLRRAYGRLSNLVGLPEAGRFLQIRAADALEDGLDKNDSRVLIQRLMVADEFARTGKSRYADTVYRAVAKRARATGQTRILGHAMLREAVMYGAISGSWPQYRQEAKRRIRLIEETREPELASFRMAAKLLRAQLAMYEGDQKALEAAFASMPPQPGKPMLVYAPPIVLNESSITSNKEEAPPEWVEVRFRIASAGTVHDVEMLRDSGNIDSDWPKPVYKAVAARRYAPVALPPGSEGAIRVERFSYVRDSVLATGSRIRERKREGRISSLDITDDTISS